MRVNNRKLAQGFYLGLEIENPADVLRQVDKIDKIGPEARAHAAGRADRGQPEPGRPLRRTGHASPRPTPVFIDRVRALGVRHEQLDEGLELLADVVSTAARYVPGRLIADLKIARGLDYYTGTVYETELVGYAAWGSVSSGGRYEALASDGRTTYPGVGLSIGVTRLLAPLFAAGKLVASRPVPTVVLVAVDAEEPAGPTRSRSPNSSGRGASPARWRRRPTSSASRSATPTAAASRTSGSSARTATRSRTSAPATRSAPTRRSGAARRGSAADGRLS